MRTGINDLLLLLLISGIVSCVMLVPGKKNAYVEHNWGSVFYSSPVTRSEANRLADVLVQEEVFQGIPTSVRLCRRENHHEWSIAFRQDYESVMQRGTMVQLVTQIWHRAFPNRSVSIVLTDELFRPFEVLIPPPSRQCQPDNSVDAS